MELKEKWYTPRRTKNGKGKTMYIGMGVTPHTSGNGLMLYMGTPKGKMYLTEKQHPKLYQELAGALASVGIKV